MATQRQRQDDASRKEGQDHVMGVVPPDPTMPDEAGEMDYTRGDPTRVREDPGGSAKSAAERDAEEARRRKLYREGASEVSNQD